MSFAHSTILLFIALLSYLLLGIFHFVHILPMSHVGKDVFHGDLISSDNLASLRCGNNMETSVEGKRLSYLDVARKGLLKKE